MNGGPLAPPYVVEFGDHLYDPAADPDGHVIRVTIGFDAATRAITQATVYRAADCRWTKILVGLGADDAPDSTATVFDLAGFSGARDINVNLLSRPPWNVDTIEDFLDAGQITAGT